MRTLAVVGLVGVIAVALALALAAGTDADRPGAGHESVLERLRRHVAMERVERDEEPVRTAQRALRARGYDAGDADGRLGPKTRAAVRAFQHDEGLGVTGRLDTMTMARLRADQRDQTGSASPRHEDPRARRDPAAPAASR